MKAKIDLLFIYLLVQARYRDDRRGGSCVRVPATSLGIEQAQLKPVLYVEVEMGILHKANESWDLKMG